MDDIFEDEDEYGPFALTYVYDSAYTVEVCISAFEDEGDVCVMFEIYEPLELF